MQPTMYQGKSTSEWAMLATRLATTAPNAAVIRLDELRSNPPMHHQPQSPMPHSTSSEPGKPVSRAICR